MTFIVIMTELVHVALVMIIYFTLIGFIHGFYFLSLSFVNFIFIIRSRSQRAYLELATYFCDTMLATHLSNT